MASLGNYSEASRDHLRNQNPVIVKQAFNMRMQLSAYWKSVILRLVDGVALHLLYFVKNLVETNLEKFILDELIGKAGIEKMLHETPATEAEGEASERFQRRRGKSYGSFNHQR
ncbi:hypothetical protein ZOSMA_252G00110 [Zostera marina]|uniref:GED domain-containing protein n=1 Tax=Zostera marina TaxID=29655 RepID=A0A0K9PI34_ZOSMR|nr:hypothetical protein ZOSMA_252G00110 [Zostera marina]